MLYLIHMQGVHKTSNLNFEGGTKERFFKPFQSEARENLFAETLQMITRNKKLVATSNKFYTLSRCFKHSTYHTVYKTST